MQQSFLVNQLDLHDMAVLDSQERGAIYTRREVVEFILDLVGYTSDHPLATMRLLEPSIGQGNFLLVALERLLVSLRICFPEQRSIALLSAALCGVELHGPTFDATRQKVVDRLIQEGFSVEDAEALADSWLIHGDFLLTPLEAGFDFVIGNPPYVRQELISDTLMAAYRARYRTIYDRADLYVPFIERSLFLLAEDGQLGFICPDRWMKNRYGGPLRQLVAEHFHFKTYVNMVDTPAFHSDVIAYPAIIIIAHGPGNLTQIAHRPEISTAALTTLAAELTMQQHTQTATVRSVAGIAKGAEPWILDVSDQVQLVRRLEQAFPTLEEAGCRVGIGIATGADKAFIGRYDDLDVEADRKLPLVMTRDILTGQVEWRGLVVINPFDAQGNLVKLANYPRLQRYLEERREVIAGRHVAQKTPANWYRTIDRIYPELVSQPKLLIPDIKGEAHIVYEEGQYYPHHNLYFVTSNEWDLRALQAVLCSGIARLFVSTYSTRMRGGYLRFQAQYLRRIRIPRWCDIPKHHQQALMMAGTRNDIQAARQIVATIYRLSDAEWAMLGDGVEGIPHAA